MYQDRYQQIYRVTVDFGDFTKEYFVRDTGRRAGLVVVQEGSVLLVRQYRLLLNDLSWEIPGGKVEDGETPEEAAIRECLEEAGVQCRNLKPLMFFQPGLDILHNPTHLFYSDDWAMSVAPHVQRKEIQDHRWMSLPTCIEKIFGQQIMDSMSIVALLTYSALMGRR